MIQDPLALWHGAGKRFDFAGHAIFYRDECQGGQTSHAGPTHSGENVLLVHGFPTASWDWHQIWADLNAVHRLIAPDLLGFGFSDKPFPHPYSVAEQTDLIETLLAHLGLEQVHIIAHDLGDTVIQELLAREQAGERQISHTRIASVCLLNGGIFAETMRPRVIQRLLASPLGGLLSHLVDKRRVLKSLAAVFGPQTQPSERELDAYWTLISRENGRRVMPAVLRYLGERHRHRDRWVGALQDASMPMRFINGALDPVSGKPMADRYRELIRLADVVQIDSVGHFPQLEAPDAVLDACLDLIQRASG